MGTWYSPKGFGPMKASAPTKWGQSNPVGVDPPVKDAMPRSTRNMGTWYSPKGFGPMKASAPTGNDRHAVMKWNICTNEGNMPMEPFPMRKNLRLKDYDYSTDGAYFITICTDGKAKILSDIIPTDDGTKNVLSSVGQIVEQYIKSIPGIDVYVIMPNHVHMIIMKSNGKPIYSEIRSFKGLTVKNSPGLRWQRNYYEHVIRDDEDYRVKREYIEDNPRRWADDDYY